MLKEVALAFLFAHAQCQLQMSSCTKPTCPNPPCAAPLVGDVGCTTVAGIALYSHAFLTKGGSIPAGAHIFGPFEAGFTAQQKNIIEGWGCTDPTVVYDTEGGLDLMIAEEKVAKACNVAFPSISGNAYNGIVGQCGGHTKDYHFHVRLGCLYTESGGHSTKVGEITSTQFLYGKWEDYSNKMLPYLDACGGHFGVTPDSNGASVYHYHVQDKPPFTVGCLGPAAGNKLMTVQGCRNLYTAGNRKCDTSGYATIPVTRNGQTVNVEYDKWCPCFGADGKNLATNIQELPAISTTAISYKYGGTTTTIAGQGNVATTAAPVASRTRVSSCARVAALWYCSLLIFHVV
jgi:hypothetical protein